MATNRMFGIWALAVSLLAAGAAWAENDGFWVGGGDNHTTNAAHWVDVDGNALTALLPHWKFTAPGSAVFADRHQDASTIVVGSSSADTFVSEGTTNFVVWTAAQREDTLTNGISKAADLYVGNGSDHDSTHKFGALRIDGGEYKLNKIFNGHDASAVMVVASGRVYAADDVRVAENSSGLLVVGQDSGDPAEFEVSPAKWLSVAHSGGSGACSLVVKKTGVLSLAHAKTERANDSSIVLDGGMIVRNGDNPNTHELMASAMPLVVTENGGTIRADVPVVISAPLRGSGTFVKTGAKDLLLKGSTDDFTGNAKVAGGNFRIMAGRQLQKVELAGDGVLEVDFSSAIVDGSTTVCPVKDGGEFTMPEGESLAARVKAVNTNGLVVTVSEMEDGRPLFSVSVEPSAAVAKIGEVYYRTLESAAAAAHAGDRVEVLKDLQLTDAAEFAEDVTLDLGTHKVTRTTESAGLKFDGGVVSNGVLTTSRGREAAGVAVLDVADGKSLSVVDVTIGSEGSEPSTVFQAGKKSTVLVSNVVCRATTLFSCQYEGDDAGVFELSSSSLDFRGWHVRSITKDESKYRKGKISLTGGSYSLAPRPGYLADGYVVQHVPSDTAFPYRVVRQEGSGLVQIGRYWYADQATADVACVATLNGEKYTSIEDAVIAAKGGDTIEVVADISGLHDMVVIDKDLTINGNGHLVKVPRPFVDESGYVSDDYILEFDAVFRVLTGADAAIRDLHVMGGGCLNPTGNNATTGFAVWNSGTLLLENVTITRSNGAVYNDGNGRLYMDNCRLVRNCRYCAGGLLNIGFAVMNRTSLSENRSISNAGGGGATENGHYLYVNNCVMCNNSSTEIGGAINNYNSHNDVKVYLMNTTIAGNFSAAQASSNGGGIGLRASKNPGSMYCVNSLVCSNYQINLSQNGSISTNDISALANDMGAENTMTNLVVYSAYGTWNPSGKTANAVNTFESNKVLGVDYPADMVFRGYEASVRVYENKTQTSSPLTGAQLLSKDDGSLNADLARYAPVKKDGVAVFGENGAEGVNTYFDASGWKSGVVRMSYRTLDGEMTALGDLQAAPETAIVTNFYERAYGRTIGIAGASGVLEDEIEYFTVRLSREPENGSAAGVTLYGDTYAAGTEVTVSATPDFACSFLGWFSAADDTLLWSDAVHTIVVSSDLAIYPKFSAPSETVTYKVTAKQADENGDFPITLTSKWLQDNKGSVDLTDPTAVRAFLDEVNPDNGLRRWHEYVLGLSHGAKIWINSPALWDAGKIRMQMNELAPTKGTGFTVKYLLGTKARGGESFSDGAYSTTSTFDLSVASDPTGFYRISIAFVPDGCDTSNERVVTVNTAGVLKVTSSAAKLAIASPWCAFSPNGSSHVSAANLVKTMNLTPGDRLHVYDGEGSGKYRSWQLREGGAWEALGTFALDEHGNISASFSDAPDATTVPRGAGAWLERQDVTKVVYLVGQLDGSAVTTALSAGWNLVGSPTGSDFDVSKLAYSDGDQIVIPTGAEPKNCTYENGAWGYNVSTEIELRGRKFSKTVRVTEGLTVPAGMAFWYISGSGGKSIQW